MMKVGYVVKWGKDSRFYTYNKSLAVKFAKKNNGTVLKASKETIKKAIDISF